MRKKTKNIKSLFPQRVKELRLEKGMTQKELAEKLEGLSANAVSEWETRGKEPNFTTLMDISVLFGVSTDYILGLEDL